MQSKALKKIIKNPTAMVCIALLLVIIFACTFCKVLAPYGFDDQELANRLQGRPQPTFSARTNTAATCFRACFTEGRTPS